MKFNLRFYAGYAFLFVLWIVFGSRASNPPDGHTNAPFNNFCADCHTGSSPLDGTVSISGLPDMIEASQTYSITLTVEATTGAAVRAGFQMVSVFAAGNTNAGDFIPNSSDEGSSSTGGREYIDHRGPKTFSNNTASWTFDWIAPDGPDDAVITMYYAGNITNGNGSSTGDRPRSGNTSFTLSAATETLASSITNQSDVSCHGANDGIATVTVTGGSTPYSYAWSTGQSTSTASDLSAGSYGVTVTDDDGNMVESLVTISEPGVLQEQSAIIDVSCFGATDGSIAVTPNGGTSPYSYDWSNGMSSSTITNLMAGAYTVTITDQNQCFLVQEFSITEPEELMISVQSTDETFNMSNDGTATVSASGGSGNYLYEWSNGSAASSIADLAPGSYIITVTDDNQCSKVDMVTVQAFTCSLQTTFMSTDVSCYGDSTGSISVSVSGAVDPVTYIWSNGMTGASISDLSAGMYDVTIQDADACQKIVSVIILEPDSLFINLDINHPNCPGGVDGSLLSIPVGGVAPYRYQWSTGDTIELLPTIGSGDFQITVTDQEGCISSIAATIMPSDSIQPLIRAGDRDVYFDSLGIAGFSPKLFDNGTSDNCSLDSLWVDIDQANCTDTTIAVQFFAMDDSGNVGDTTVFATLLDTIIPWFACIGDIVADSGQVVHYETPVAFDNCTLDSFEMIEGLPSGSVFPVGETKVSYMATDAAGNIGCCSFLVIVGQTTSSLNPEFSKKVRIYPNPVSEVLTIDLQLDGNRPVDIDVLNNVGQNVSKYTYPDLGQVKINVRDLSAGFYFLRIRRDGQMAVKKLIKK